MNTIKRLLSRLFGSARRRPSALPTLNGKQDIYNPKEFRRDKSGGVTGNENPHQTGRRVAVLPRAA